MKIINNPIDTVLQAFINIYGEQDVIIYIDYDMPIQGKNKHWGETIDGEDGKKYIALNGRMRFDYIGEILSHELAHLVTLDDFDHGERWCAAFDKIHAEFIRLGQELSNQGGD